MSFVRCGRKLCHSLFFERSALAKFEWFCKTDHSSERGEREDYSTLGLHGYSLTLGPSAVKIRVQQSVQH